MSKLNPVTDNNAGKPMAKGSAGDEQARTFTDGSTVANGIFEAFRRSSTIPTTGKKGVSPHRRSAGPTPEDIEEEEVEIVESDEPMTLADLRRQMEAKKKKSAAKKKQKRAAVMDEDGGVDVRRMKKKRKASAGPASGASLAAGALSAMRKQQ